MEFPSRQILTHTDFRHDEEVSCDAVVVGSGAGGAVVAYVLAHAGLKVALLEEGRKFEPHELSTRPSWAYRHLYAERNTRIAKGNAVIPLPGGRAVGGSTLLNSAICFRTPKKVLDHWQQAFGVDWADAQTLQATFRTIEEVIGVQKTQPGIARGNNLIFKQGAEALKMRGDFISRNAPGCVGCGLCQLGCPVGGKGSVDRNFVPMAVDLGAALFTSTRAWTWEGKAGRTHALVSQVIDPLSEHKLFQLKVIAPKIFLCGGAIGTPLFLFRQKEKISLEHVGKHLRVHPASGMCAKFSQLIDAWDGVTQGYYVELENAILETFSATPDLYFTQYEAFSKPPETLRHLASCGVMVGDVSEGEVKPSDSTRADIRYHLQEVDKEKLIRGLYEIGRAYFAAGAQEVHPGIYGHSTAKNLSELEKMLTPSVPLTAMSVYASHPMGTCRMSAKPEDGVVKPSGELWGLENVFVADASVFPTAVGVNPQVTVMAAAMKIAEGVVARG